MYEKAYELLLSRKLHPWEGGEGRAAAQYIAALVKLAKEKMRGKAYGQAKELLKEALVYPENIGEGKIEGSKDNNIYYYLGLVEEALGETEAAKEHFLRASTGSDAVAGMMYKLIDFGEEHLRDQRAYYNRYIKQ